MTKFSDKTTQAAFKAFGLQTTTQQIVEKLQALAPTRQLNKSFMQIVSEGTGKTFVPEDNENWLAVTRRHPRGIFSRALFSGDGSEI